MELALIPVQSNNNREHRYGHALGTCIGQQAFVHVGHGSYHLTPLPEYKNGTCFYVPEMQFIADSTLPGLPTDSPVVEPIHIATKDVCSVDSLLVCLAESTEEEGLARYKRKHKKD
jgi:hypothetical protein